MNAWPIPIAPSSPAIWENCGCAAPEAAPIIVGSFTAFRTLQSVNRPSTGRCWRFGCENGEHAVPVDAVEPCPHCRPLP